MSSGRDHGSMTELVQELAVPLVAPAEACVRCGHDADFDIASMWLCIDCYHIAGSTCSGIGPRPDREAATQGPDQVC